MYGNVAVTSAGETVVVVANEIVWNGNEQKQRITAEPP